MSKTIRGRDWKWWVVRNDHRCRFCEDRSHREREATTTILGIVAKLRLEDMGYKDVYQGHPRYWGMLYHVFMEHMKEEHPDILAEPTPECMRNLGPTRDVRRRPRLTR